MQILVLGMHRSGTSATAALIHKMGAFFGPPDAMLPPNPANPKGFWERKDVNQLNDAILRLQSCRWSQLASWDAGKASKIPEPLQQDMKKLLDQINPYQPWCIKDPRLCLTLPAWLPHLTRPIAVIVYRDPYEIAASLHKRDNMPKAYALALWEMYVCNLMNAVGNLPRIFIQHEALMVEPVSVCRALYKQLEMHDDGLKPLTPQTIEAFIDPSLYRSHVGEHTLSPHQQHIARVMQGEPMETPLTISEESRAIIQATK